VSLRWVVVGAGSIGRRHLRNLRALGVRDLAAVRRDGTPLDGDLADVPVRRSVEDARGSGPAVAIVCTPTALHLDAAIAAGRSGYHVLVEKPLADDLGRLKELRTALEHAQTKSGVAHVLRWHPAVRAVRERLARGDLGRPLHAAVWCGQHLEDWRPGSDHRASYSARRDLGGGVVLDLSHEIDELQWLFGRPCRVSARTVRTGALDIETEDVADLILEFPQGPVASCHLDYLARPAVRGGTANCERGSLRWDLLRPSVEVSSGDGWSAVPLPARWQRNDMYIDELRAFAAHVTDGSPFDSDLDAGALAVATALAAKRASDRGAAEALA
jgi:predicted dehydrogenase